MITIFIMGKKGFETLKSIVENGYKQIIDFVVISKDQNIREDYYDQICYFCKTNEIESFDRHSQYKVRSIYSIAIAWRWIINLQKNQKLIVLHDSLLPRLRGFNPLVTALINGDKRIGVTAIFAVTEFDKGDIIDQESISIKYPIKIQYAIDLISTCYAKITFRIFQKINNNIEIIGDKQDEQFSTYSVWRDDEDYHINWHNNASQIVRFINAVGFPYNGARTFMNGLDCIIEDAEEFPDVTIENRTPGKVIFMIDNKPVIICGSGLIKINKFANSKSLKTELPIKCFRTRFK